MRLVHPPNQRFSCTRRVHAPQRNAVQLGTTKHPSPPRPADSRITAGHTTPPPAFKSRHSPQRRKGPDPADRGPSSFAHRRSSVNRHARTRASPTSRGRGASPKLAWTAPSRVPEVSDAANGSAPVPGVHCGRALRVCPGGRVVDEGVDRVVAAPPAASTRGGRGRIRFP